MKTLVRKVVLLATILTVGCAVGDAVRGYNLEADPSPAPPADAPAPSVQGPRKRALLIGINTYKHSSVVPSLFGTLNDVEDIRSVLTSREYGFEAEDVHSLRNQEATRKRILEEIDAHLIDGARLGDILVFYYSGHGSLMDNPKDPTGVDNTIVPYDSRDPQRKVADITDKELRSRVRAMLRKVGDAGAVAVVLDSCHSGTGLRGAVTRAAPKDTRFGSNPPPADLGREPAGTRDVTGSGYGDVGLKYALIAGSRSEQSSYERTGDDGRINGALTHFLVQELRRLPRVKRTYRELMEIVTRRVNSEFRAQVPQLEGLDSNRVVFGDETIETKQYLVARAAAGGLVEFEAGTLHGLTEQSEFEIYGPDARALAPPEVPLTTVTITDAQPLTSTGRMSPWVRLPEGAKAVERKHAFRSRRTPILFEQLRQSAALQRIKAQLDRGQNKPFQSVSPEARFQLRLSEEDGRVHLFGPDGDELSPPIAASDPRLADRMEARLLSWDRWFSLLELDNPSSSIQIEARLTPAGAAEPLPRGQPASFTPGPDKFTLQVANQSQIPVFLYILNLTSSGKSQQIYPDLGANVSIDPGQVLKLPPGGTALPAGSTYIRDVLKIIATSHQTDLRFLELETPKGEQGRGVPPSDPLGVLLFNAAMGVKNATFKAPSTWAVADVAFEVCEQLDPPLHRCQR